MKKQIVTQQLTTRREFLGQAAALAAVEGVVAAGGKVVYRSLDLRDATAVQGVVDEIRAAHGHIDLVVHAAGLLIDKILPDKQPQQFDLVFDVKADGLFNLLKAGKGMPIGATVAFGSAAVSCSAESVSRGLGSCTSLTVASMAATAGR